MMMSMKHLWFIVMPFVGTLGHVPQHGKKHNKLRHKAARHQQEAAAGDYSDTTIHGDDGHFFSPPKLEKSPAELKAKQQLQAHHLLARKGAQGAAHHHRGGAHASNIPGVDYGDVQYPELMGDIDDLYDMLKK